MKRFLLIGVLLFLFACDDEQELPAFEPPTIGSNVIVLNEGNFQSANGSISVYNTSTLEVHHKIFQSNNSSRPLGDVVQSMVRMDNRYFIVVNNSEKIEVVNAVNFKSVGKIGALNSPRYILPISATKAYVSDLYEGSMHIINPQDLSIAGKIETKGWTEEMLLLGDTAFVCQVDSHQVWLIDTKTDTIINKIRTNLQPQHLVQDMEGKIWVSCSGGINEAFPALHRIDPKNMEIEKTLELKDIAMSIGEMELNQDGTKILYLLSNSSELAVNVFELPINSTVLPSNPLIPSNGRLFYGMKVHDTTGEIYLSDAIDYQQKGVVYRMDPSGNLISTFKAGIIPGAFYIQD